MPVSASNNRFYGINGSYPTYSVFSVDSQANSLISYAQGPYFIEFNQNLPDGTLLGIAGNQLTGIDALVKSDLQGNVNPFYQFPLGEVLPGYTTYGTDGNYYGVSWQEYINGSYSTGGYIYQVTPAGVLNKLYTLPLGTFSTISYSVPIQWGTDGNLYGVTTTGGANGYGSIYQLTIAGQFTTLYSFPKGPGAYPTSLIQASDGNLYVASIGVDQYRYGQLSRFTTTGQYTFLHAMAGGSGSCPCTLTQGSDAAIYGTAGFGGAGGGTIFALNAGLPIPAPNALNISPSSGPPETKVRIWGYNMLKATVSFNGTAATKVTHSGPNYVFALVPKGATSGPITVITPGGTSTTPTSFTVTK